VAEDDRVGDLHHRRLEVHGEQHALALASGDLRLEEGRARGALMTVASTTSPSSTFSPSLSTVVVPSVATCSMRSVVVGGEVTDCSLERKSSALHVRDVRSWSRAPGAHRVRVLAGVVLHRGGCAAVGVALAQDRVDGAALDLVVARLDVALLVALRVLRVVGQRVALRLQLGDGGLELRHEALMFGSLMMLASGVFASSPSSVSASPTRWSSGRWSGNWREDAPASEMSRVSTSTPAVEAKACTIGRKLSTWRASGPRR
jgi:hypothetical protein